MAHVQNDEEKETKVASPAPANSIADCPNDLPSDAEFKRKLAERRARRLAIPVEELENLPKREPQFLSFAARRAKRAGISVHEVLADGARRMDQSGYPAPECLAPFEVEEYLASGVPDWRQEHLQHCPICASLLEAARDPDQERLLDVIDEVRVLLMAFQSGNDDPPQACVPR